jgi:hypothetical protein
VLYCERSVCYACLHHNINDVIYVIILDDLWLGHTACELVLHCTYCNWLHFVTLCIFNSVCVSL